MGQIRGLDDTLTPLARVQVSLSQTQVSSLPAEVRQRLRVGVIWAGINLPSSWCAEQLNRVFMSPNQSVGERNSQSEDAPDEHPQNSGVLTPESLEHLFQLLTLCPDPLGVVPALAGPSSSISEGVEREGSLDVEIIFTALPPAEVIIGTPDARVAYGSLVIFDDINEDGVLNIGFSTPPIFEKGRESSDEENDDDFKNRRRFEDEPIDPDIVYGASFLTLLDSQKRLAFREGDFVESFFYPLGGCEPPPGMSIMMVEPEEVGDLEETHCQAQSIGDPLALELARPDSRLQELVCEPTPVWVSRAENLTPYLEDQGLKLTCLSSWELAVSSTESSCKTLSIFRLVDCPSHEPECDDPGWDDRAQPPLWWPCDALP